MKPIVIAIDGHSSTGKSTVAKKLAKELEYKFVDTGAMYRAVTLFAMRNNWLQKGEVDEQKLIENLPSVTINFEYNLQSGSNDVILNGENVEQEIRAMEVSENVSSVARIDEVRTKLVQIQKQLGEEKGVVMDGRDIGSVVFPEAELKIFMTASADIRAQRRYKELKEKGEKISFEDVLKNVKHRDDIDTNRKNSPLIQADDAIKIDNSNMSQEEQFEKILNLAKESIEA
ncbi:(d)CMP kinase [Psychroflexus sp. CAK57W]|uniref:(d)CMP kinase n=1 Tax=Psychroflexus curvus TaxID=2873595 RepID=UPI001CC96A4A|nr:(d)CMP kinase [Psychroflexus curvus]MBZ9628473.1 (d)CMP kinase [Psychroflexus curvus]MBZ9788080.1 (d)CMP kinase [Psychroflexus curvus]